jgi:hypothetical protein
LDGVFVAGPNDGDAKPVFHILPCISDTAVADLLQIIRARLMRFLVRRQVVEADGDTLLLADDLEQRDPALAQLAAAAGSCSTEKSKLGSRRRCGVAVRDRPTNKHRFHADMPFGRRYQGRESCDKRVQFYRRGAVRPRHQTAR